jgi:hydroxymethylbilane synthase
MRAAILNPEGTERVELTQCFAQDDLQGPSRLAGQLLEQAPEAIRMHFAGPAGD